MLKYCCDVLVITVLKVVSYFFKSFLVPYWNKSVLKKTKTKQKFGHVESDSYYNYILEFVISISFILEVKFLFKMSQVGI